MDEKHLVPKDLGACKNSGGSSSLPPFVSLDRGSELGFLSEGMVWKRDTPAGGKPQRPPKEQGLWVREQKQVKLSPNSKLQSLSVAPVPQFYTRSQYRTRIQLWDFTFT